MDEDRTAAQTSDRLNARDYKVDYMDNDRPHLLLDVRSRPETEICKLPNSRNIPIDDIDKNLDRIRSEVSILPPVKNKKRVVVCCRRGNDSKSAVIKLRAHFKVCSHRIFTIYHVITYPLVPKESNVTLVPHIILIRINTLTKC